MRVVWLAVQRRINVEEQWFIAATGAIALQSNTFTIRNRLAVASNTIATSTKPSWIQVD